jgi:hypothetical protein
MVVFAFYSPTGPSLVCAPGHVNAGFLKAAGAIRGESEWKPQFPKPLPDPVALKSGGPVFFSAFPHRPTGPEGAEAAH